ncbi:MAG: LptF/LptG family permease [Nitrospirae bacterium]|nr:LptF/LptG family permease [Nitrospirota bacterium]
MLQKHYGKTRVKLIQRSTFRDLLLTFSLSLAFLNSILMMEKLIRLSRLLSGVGASIFDMGRIILYIQPQLLMLTIPMSLLLSVLLVYGRMNLDSEIVVLKSSGMDFMNISRPVLLLGAFCFLATLAVSFYIGPRSSVTLRETIAEIIAARSAMALEEGTFNSSFKDIVIVVKGKKSADMIEDIFIYDNRKKDEPKVLMAKHGKFFSQDNGGVGLYLTDGYINIMHGTITTEFFFEKYNMILNLDSESAAPKKMEFTPSQLLEQSRTADSDKRKVAFYLELHRRFSLPAVCLILAFLGPPLALASGKSGKLGGLALGLFVFTLYYTLLIYGENLVTAGKMPHYLGAWLATALMGIFSGVMFRKESLR